MMIANRCRFSLIVESHTHRIWEMAKVRRWCVSALLMGMWRYKERKTDSEGSQRVWLQFDGTWGGSDMLRWVVLVLWLFPSIELIVSRLRLGVKEKKSGKKYLFLHLGSTHAGGFVLETLVALTSDHWDSTVTYWQEMTWFRPITGHFKVNTPLVPGWRCYVAYVPAR